MPPSLVRLCQILFCPMRPSGAAMPDRLNSIFQTPYGSFSVTTVLRPLASTSGTHGSLLNIRCLLLTPASWECGDTIGGEGEFFCDYSMSRYHLTASRENHEVPYVTVHISMATSPLCMPYQMWLCRAPSGRTGKSTSEMAVSRTAKLGLGQPGGPLAMKKAHLFFEDNITLGQYVRI
jgi:hypothetical protein